MWSTKTLALRASAWSSIVARRGGAYRSQAVVDGTGLMGQLFRVGPWSAEVMLITDPEHAVPVQVVRNGFRIHRGGHGRWR